MRRVLFFVREYPQISDTYIRTEIDRVRRRFAVSVACLAVPALVPTATDGYRAATTT